MKFKFSSLVDRLVSEFWAILLIDLNLGSWFDKLLHKTDNLIHTENYPPIFDLYFNDDGYLSWGLSGYYKMFHISLNWRGQITKFKADLVIEVDDPAYNQYCQNLIIGYPMAGLFQCGSRIETQIDILRLM